MNKLILAAVSLCVSPCLSALEIEQADSSSVINLDNVEIVANRADKKTPVAFTNVTKSQLAKINDGHDIPFL